MICVSTSGHVTIVSLSGQIIAKTRVMPNLEIDATFLVAYQEPEEEAGSSNDGLGVLYLTDFNKVLNYVDRQCL